MADGMEKKKEPGLLSGDVKIGNQRVPKSLAYGGGAVVFVLVVMWYRNRKSNSSSSSTTTDQFPSDGTVGDPTDPFSVDPVTGITYGNEAASTGGAFSFPATTTGTPIDGGGGGGSNNSGTPTGPPFSTNDQWSQYVIQYFSDQSVVDIGAFTDAIGLYLNGTPITSAQAQFVQDAIAVGGTPPVSGPNNRPPSWQLSDNQNQPPPGGGGTPPPGGGGGGTPPPSNNWSFPKPSGLQTYDKSKTGYRLKWNAVHGPSGQQPSSYTVQTWDSHNHMVDEFTVNGTVTAEYGHGGHGLPKGTYHTLVWANGGPKAPSHAEVSITI